MVRVLISVPKRVKRGEAFDVKLLISHPMESGQRRDDMGQAIPRDIINSFVCTFDGDEVLRADLFPAIAANPFLSFAVVVQESGTLAMTFTDDHGAVQTETASVTVE
ncbi:MAG TPA: thiosulfate oxidation carrier complex protein SoxZ [Acetobacteraceae bacterium]|jgi:sulfur-oxidizing protein SoxZ|nr:thiosulfate oxidation carrier complex protein SoxZ [Acetobacteraceae bacterium]